MPEDGEGDDSESGDERPAMTSLQTDFNVPRKRE